MISINFQFYLHPTEGGTRKLEYITYCYGFPLKLIHVPWRDAGGYSFVNVNANYLLSETFTALYQTKEEYTAAHLNFLRLAQYINKETFAKRSGVSVERVDYWNALPTISANLSDSEEKFFRNEMCRMIGESL